jgi:hypothetical protein
MTPKRFVLEGTWRGYTSRQDHVCHREVCSESKAAWANDTYCILFTDGTTLELRARPAKPREKVELKAAYTSLIDECFRKGVNSVAELSNLEKAAKERQARIAEASHV